jgi:hypothetical protein
MHRTFLLEYFVRKQPPQAPRFEGTATLKWTLRKDFGVVWAGFIWLMTGISGGLFWTW